MDNDKKKRRCIFFIYIYITNFDWLLINTWKYPKIALESIKFRITCKNMLNKILNSGSLYHETNSKLTLFVLMPCKCCWIPTLLMIRTQWRIYRGYEGFRCPSWHLYSLSVTSRVSIFCSFFIRLKSVLITNIVIFT